MQSSNVEAVLNDLKREIETMAQLQHENVVNLLGVTAGEGGPQGILLIAYIYCLLSSLRAFT